MNVARACLAVAGLVAANEAAAHGSTLSWDVAPSDSLRVILPLLAIATLYASGLLRRAARGTVTGPHLRRAAGFGLAMLLLAAALVWPLDAWAAHSFAAHMAQHMVLLVLAPPLLLLGRPVATCLHALPTRLRRSVVPVSAARAFAALRPYTRSLGATSVVHGALLWAWHVPAAFELALRNDAIHWLEHLTLLAGGMLFWRALLSARGTRLGWGMVWMLVTVIHSGMLGALITLAPRPLYPLYVQRGLEDPLADQQLAGLIMWVPMGSVYLLAALLFAARALRADTQSQALNQESPCAIRNT